MRALCLLFFLAFAAPFLMGQNYYVAVVKGNVYYNDKLLKKRDKIKIKGTLRFTTKEDYVKFSGPGGLHTIRPGIDEESSNEFFVALREELFPRIRPHSTSSDGTIAMSGSQHYFELRGYTGYYLDETYLIRPLPNLAEGEEVGFLHETSRGLQYKTAQIIDNYLQIREQDFSLRKNNELKKTAIVKVRDKSEWLQLIEGKDSIAQVEPLVDRYSWGFEMVIGPDEEEEVEETPLAAEILDFMGPPIFVNRKKMVKDLRFHLRKSKAPDQETFLLYYQYETYILETYGPLREYPDIENVMAKDLKLESRYKSAVDPVIIPND